MSTAVLTTNQKRVILALGYSKDTVKDIVVTTKLSTSEVKPLLEKLTKEELAYQTESHYDLTDLGERVFDRLVKQGVKVESRRLGN
jgi:predicted transcriptional regulator